MKPGDANNCSPAAANGRSPSERGTLIVAIFGPPGSGKGTQAGWLCEKYGLDHVSTGDLLRAERKAGTELGLATEALMSRGELVPDEMVGEIVRRKLQFAAESGRGVLLDGYPRTLGQLARLKDILAEMDLELAYAVFLRIEDELLIERLTGRRICENCHRAFNVTSRRPAVEGICDGCGGRLVQRADDREEVISTRLNEYHRKTRPILDALNESGKLRTIRADQSVDEVRRQLREVLGEWENGVAAL